MTAARPGIRFTFFAFAFLIASSVCAQSDPAALRKADASVFGGVTGIYTGLSGGRDGAVTAGLDLTLPEIFRVRPSLEVRATTPFDRGTVDRQKDILGGFRLETRLGRLHPYLDLLGGFRLETRLGRLHPYLDLLGGRGQITFDGSYLTFAGTTISSHPPTSSLRVSEPASISARSSPSSPTPNSSVGAPPHPSPATSSPNPSPSV